MSCLSLPRTRVAKPSCHGSNWISMSASRPLMRGQPLDLIVSGKLRWCAASDSRGVEGFVCVAVDTRRHLLLVGQVHLLDFLGDVLQPARQRRQVARRAIRVRDGLGDTLTHRDQKLVVV